LSARSELEAVDGVGAMQHAPSEMPNSEEEGLLQGHCSSAVDVETVCVGEGRTHYCDEKVANREIRVWHGATEKAP
jgi:hypothetical protein